MTSGIYEIRNTETGDRYIGSATRMAKRFSAHKCYLRKGRHHCEPLQRAWDKYGAAAFEFRSLIVCGPADLLLREQWAIDAYLPKYNVAIAAGNAMRGRKHSAATKARISARLLGRVHSALTRARIGEAGRGRIVSAETRRKLSLALTGKKNAAGSKGRLGSKASAETRLRLSKSHMGKKPTDDTRRKMSEAQTRAWAIRKVGV